MFNVRTFFVKFFSAATAVASGLPVGPEGPMIHMGAIAGTRMKQSTHELAFSMARFAVWSFCIDL